MKFTPSTIILSLVSSVIALTSVDQVINDIINLNSAVVDLTAATAAYQGGLFDSIPQGFDFIVVEARLTQGDTDSGLLPPALSESDTQDLIDTVASTLAINNPKAVQTLKSKKALIDASHETAVVELGLQALLAGHLDFTQHIVSRSPASKIQAVRDVANIITVALQGGINTFAS